jgi:hypothetical protein
LLGRAGRLGFGVGTLREPMASKDGGPRLGKGLRRPKTRQPLARAIARARRRGRGGMITVVVPST